jgi:hypothetical protein
MNNPKGGYKEFWIWTDVAQEQHVYDCPNPFDDHCHVIEYAALTAEAEAHKATAARLQAEIEFLQNKVRELEQKLKSEGE